MSPAADVYSLGTLLLVLLTGKAAFDSEHISYAISDAQEEEQLQPLNVCNLPQKVFEKLLILGVKCCCDRAKRRPSLEDIFNALRVRYTHHLYSCNTDKQRKQITKRVFQLVVSPDRSLLYLLSCLSKPL